MQTDKLTTEEPVRAEVLARVRKRRDLHGHVLLYVLVNTAAGVIWASTGSGYPRPGWLTGAWAIGLIMTLWDVYVRKPIPGRRRPARARPAPTRPLFDR